MLGSSFDGERANAARMIAAMAEKRGVTIPGLIFGEPIIEHVVRPSPRPRTRPQPKERPERQARPQVADIINALTDIAASEDELEFVITDWERQFCADVSTKHSFDYELSEKQIAAAQRIIDKVEKARSHRTEKGEPS